MRNPFRRFFKKSKTEDARPEERGINMIDRATGTPIEFSVWASRFGVSKKTPLLENIYDTIASEFSKVDLMLVREGFVANEDGDFVRTYKKLDDHHNYNILALRPNQLQTKSDLLYTMAYQLHKYRNALVRIVRAIDSDRNLVISLEPINCGDYLFGQGYELDGDLFLRLLEKKTAKEILINYDDVIHLRLNPNDIFYGDKNDTFDLTNFVRVFDENLSALLKSLQDAGTIRGIIEIGGGNFAGGFGASLTGQGDKIDKQKEVAERIKSTDAGVIVLDSGEKWHDLRDNFKSMTSDEINNMMKYLFNFKGINQAVIDGTATEEQMGVFFNKTIKPILIRMIEEMNYKFLTKTARSQGQRIKYFKNPFEYTTMDKLLSKLYLGAMFFTKNEVRDLALSMSPIEGGDKLLDNKNFGNIHGAGGDDNDS
ncbi:MAG: phage portal protein [Defluviitaleaceae bacterium]|nr:phage portal protein [Defluviitaleaceae bacterium]